ncbi:MAG: septation protein SepH [Candidatus Nanopelagicales bacterium]|nr:DUF3071 domain-containing protein [Actinomycetota bacterium]MBT5501256.1 DUF3071 domain-containing protein [Actinomycetota bacterium]NCG02152.1 DUF3071 domain-containing protein [Actinomycetales bacterium]
MNPLSPREIQQRVRAGESPEMVAQETGWDLERVNRYAEPPMRERAYVAQCASEVLVHQYRGSATLAEVVGNTLGLTVEQLNWDSAHLNGQWLVELKPHLGAQSPTDSAQWSYEPSGKSVNPLNALARTLMGLDPARDPGIGSAVESTIIIDTTAAALQPQREKVAQETPVATVKLTAVPELESEILELVNVEELPEASGVFEDTPESAPAPPAPTKKVRKGRAKVPSWDEILFGNNSTEE